MAYRSLKPRGLAVALSLLLTSLHVGAQMPGEWRYEIRTDASSIPVEAKGNFPPSKFSQCRTAAQFESGMAFSAQAHPSSVDRCVISDFVRTPGGKGGDTFSLKYSCDHGANLTGHAEGRIEKNRFVVQLETRHIPPADGVSSVRQTMTAKRVSDCKTQ